jgi:hypothetical protein
MVIDTLDQEVFYVDLKEFCSKRYTSKSNSSTLYELYGYGTTIYQLNL